MQVTELANSGLRREYKIVIAAKDIDEKVTSRLEEIGSSISLPGFRRGKVPQALLKKRYGPAVMGEILEQALNDSSAQAMAERGLRPAVQPKIEVTAFDHGKDLEYTLAVELMPEIAPVDFKAIELERLVPEVGDAEVDKAVAGMADEMRKTEKVDPRPAKKGDVLVIDFVGRIDGKEFPGGAAQGHHLELGSNAFITGFEDQLIGKQPGETATVKVTFPAEYGSAELAGKDAEFTVTINELRERVAVNVDEEFAKSLGMESLAKLREAMKGRLERDYAGLARMKLKRTLLDKLADAHQFAVPAGLVDSEFEAIWKQFEEAKQKNEIEKEELDKGEDALKAEYRTIAERRVRLALLLSEIGRQNNIQVAPDDVNRAMAEEARRFPGQERKVFEFYKNNPEMQARLRAPIFEDKVIDFIVEMARVSERRLPPEDLVKEATAA
ncbi:MAG: trigger factor [Alphaproteobacteria bacterium]|nr:trigger factor [Alphaproteobacteria bacterium]